MNAQRVELANLVKVFDGPGGEKVVAVDDLSLTVEPGEMVTLLGPSGCGKTTTLRMVAGFELPDSGQIFIGDQEVSRQAPNNRDTAMVFQSYALFPHMTVGENVAYGLRFRKLSKSQMQERVAQVMKLVGLEGYDRRSPTSSQAGNSSGWPSPGPWWWSPKSCCLTSPCQPRCQAQGANAEEIRRVQQSLGITSLYVTHDQVEAMSLSDKIVVMNQGKIEQVGTPQEIYRRPATRFVADFIGKVNFFPVSRWALSGGQMDVQVYEHRLTLEAPETALPRDIVVMCRPEAIQLQRDAGIPGKVRKAVYLGSAVEYTVEMPDGALATVVENNPLPGGIIQPGEEVGLVFDGQNAHVLPRSRRDANIQVFSVAKCSVSLWSGLN